MTVVERWGWTANDGVPLTVTATWPLHRSVEAAPAPAALAPLAAGRGSDRAAAVAYLHAVLLYFGLVIIIVRFASHNEW